MMIYDENQNNSDKQWSSDQNHCDIPLYWLFNKGSL